MSDLYPTIILIQWACLIALFLCCWTIYGEARTCRDRWRGMTELYERCHADCVNYKDRTKTLEKKICYWKEKAST